MSLRGQDYATQDLMDFRYRERFHLTQKELEEEPEDVFCINLAIMNVENKLYNEQVKRVERERQRNLSR